MPHKSQVRINAEKDPEYCPYCMRCPRLVRMKKTGPFQWKCGCGAVGDERLISETYQPIKLSPGCSQIVRYAKDHFSRFPRTPIEKVQDMLILVANRNAAKPEDLAEYDVVMSLLAVLRDCHYMPHDSAMSTFMSHVIFGGWYGSPIVPEMNEGPYCNFVSAVIDRLHSMEMTAIDPVSELRYDLVVLTPIKGDLFTDGPVIEFDDAKVFGT